MRVALALRYTLAGAVKSTQRDELLSQLRVLVESAVESEQLEPAPFKLETELRIEFALAKISEALPAADTP